MAAPRCSGRLRAPATLDLRVEARFAVMLRLVNIFTATIQSLGNAAHTAQSKQVNKPITANHRWERQSTTEASSANSPVMAPGFKNSQ